MGQVSLVYTRLRALHYNKKYPHQYIMLHIEPNLLLYVHQTKYTALQLYISGLFIIVGNFNRKYLLFRLDRDICNSI